MAVGYEATSEAARENPDRVLIVADLMSLANLPYRYDAAPGTAAQALSASSLAPSLGALTVAAGAPSISTAGGPVCRLLAP